MKKLTEIPLREHMKKHQDTAKRKDTIESDWDLRYASRTALTGPLNKIKPKRKVTGVNMFW